MDLPVTEDRKTNAASSNALRVGVAGLGVVGAGVARILRDNAELIAQRAGRPVVFAAASARDRNRDRGVALDQVRWHDDARALAADPEIDVVVEAIGGSDGVARELCEAALANGKHVVTANKALMAAHGVALAQAAEAKGAALCYEAAVAGGVPAIKALREGLAANRIGAVYGILNGTCNYILTEMRATGRDFAEILAEAQSLGYAEADPSFDVDGVDTAHKLAILASLAFGRPVDFASVHVEGIRRVSAADIAWAEELGYRIKLLGIARQTPHGVEQRVHPCMVPASFELASVDGVFNAVVVQGDFVGQVTLSGRGAGQGPTASAVVADLIDVARGRRTPTFGAPADRLIASPAAPIETREGPYFLRLSVLDRPGVLADLAAALRDEGVSIESFVQRGRSRDAAVTVALTTHDSNEAAMRRALVRIDGLDAVVEPAHMIRIEMLGQAL